MAKCEGGDCFLVIGIPIEEISYADTLVCRPGWNAAPGVPPSRLVWRFLERHLYRTISSENVNFTSSRAMIRT